MKTIQRFLLGWLFFTSSFSYGQPTATPVNEIKRLEEQERTAVMAGDTTTLFRLWSPGYVVNNSNNMILTAAQLKSFIRKGGIDHPSFTNDIEKISFFSNIAVVMGSETLTPKDKSGIAGKTSYRRYTNVWIKSENSWQLSARQVTTTLIQ